MYALKNRVQLIGNLGHDPEIRVTEQGKKWARFALATHESFTNPKGEKVGETQWHNLVAWGKTVEYIEENLKKGTEVLIEGKLVSRHYLDKDDIKKYVTEIQVSQLMVLRKTSSETEA